MKKIALLSFTFILFSCKSEKQLVDYINPMIGAVTYGEKTRDIHGFGKTFPGPTTPFGLVQLSPDTRSCGDNGSGYSNNHATIEGFSFTHMSGVGWFGDLGNLLMTPTIGRLHTNKGAEAEPENGYRSRFSQESETAEAGYYSVVLSDYGITTELTAAPRAGMIRFTFPESDSARIQIDLSRRIGGTSTEQYIKVENENSISGWMKCPPEGGGWGNGAGKADYTVYFWCEFSKPLDDFGVWSADIPDDWVRKRLEVCSETYQELVANATIYNGAKEMQGEHLGFFTNFKTSSDEEVLVKSGISFVNVEGAKENLENDIPHWEFDKVVADAKSSWNDAIQSVIVEGATSVEREIFYTALYHTLIDPRAYSDANGNYIGADKNIHKANKFTYRTIFCGWDVFRSQFPLQTIINPKIVNDEINSLLQIAELSGKEYLPRWDFLNAYSGCMIGNPAVSVITDAYQKGIRDYDIDKAFIYCKNSVDKFGNGELGYVANKVSETLEYAYTDWCLGKLAESLGKPEVAREYYNKSENYKNIWSEEVQWFRAKDENGEWMAWEGKTVHGQGCLESNPYQQGWFVPHDITGLKDLIGGQGLIEKELTEFFESVPEDFLWGDYYNHPNEHAHHVPFMFNEIGLPHLTQKWTRKICDKAYGNDVFGLCGNDDVGQMSAWYVLAAIGIHPVCPGDNKYQITSPVFNKIKIQLDKEYYEGDEFVIVARNNSEENIYIQSIKLNGEYLDRYWITHEEIVAGGVLELEMGKTMAVLDNSN
ncbi:MAG: GH92 family glycosyl hydrolase [Cytophagales bacterium]|nr:GH92 family glycosyl hydrolase [Cytophagales bacterium]